MNRRIDMIEMHVTAETPTKRYQIIDRFPLRIYSAEQWSSLLVAVNRFDVLATYSFDCDITCPITVTDTTEDVVFVLRKSAS
jgi:hypothetical protein